MEFIKEQEYQIEYRLAFDNYQSYLYVLADSFEDALNTFNEYFKNKKVYMSSIKKQHEIIRKSTKTIEINV